MKYKVMYTAGAKRDLRNIFIYISEELLAPEKRCRTDRPNYGCYSKAGHHAE